MNEMDQKTMPVLRRSVAVCAALLALAAPQAQAMYVDWDSYNADPNGGQKAAGNGLVRSDFTLLPTAWDPGANTGRVGGNPAPGGATYSVMGAGFLDVSGFDPGHVGATQLITSLGVAGYGAAQYAADIDAALNVWAGVSAFTNLGSVVDGGVHAGAPAPAGALGDIRVAAWEIGDPPVLAHAFNPGTELEFGPGGTVGGDLHFDVNRVWVDDAADVVGNGQFDYFTVALHELGHSLGLGHSAVVGSVMEPVYAGSRRTLHADDIAGIQAIYGPLEDQPPPPMPEPPVLWLLGAGAFGLVAARRRRQKRGS